MIRLELQSHVSGRAVVLLHGRDPQTCSRLVDSFLGLAAASGSVAVQGIPGVVASGGCELTAVRESKHLGVRSGQSYRWSQMLRDGGKSQICWPSLAGQKMAISSPGRLGRRNDCLLIGWKVVTLPNLRLQ
jgi:hypothetical protein